LPTGTRAAFTARVSELHKSFDALEVAQRGIIAILLRREPALMTMAGGIAQPPIVFFRKWIDNLLRVNLAAAGRPQQPPGVADHTVLASLQSALMHAFVSSMPPHLDGGDAGGGAAAAVGAAGAASADGAGDATMQLDAWLNVAVCDNAFASAALGRFDLGRLGGLASEVRKCHAADVADGKAPRESWETRDAAGTPEFALLGWSTMLYHLALTAPYRKLQTACVMPLCFAWAKGVAVTVTMSIHCVTCAHSAWLCSTVLHLMSSPVVNYTCT
jgi:hypothetical protein